MVIVFLLIGTLLLMGLLIGCLTWLLNVEEEPQLKDTKVLPLPPATNASATTVVQEVVTETDLEIKPAPHPQPTPEPEPEPIVMQAEETLEGM